MFNCAFMYVFVDLVFYKGLKLIPYCVDVIVVFLYECIKSSNDFSSLMLKHCSIQYTNFPFTVLCLVKQNSLFTLFSHSKQNWKYFSRFNHRGSQLYFHITRYVLKRRREDTFWGAKSESSSCTLFRFKNGLVFVLPIKLMQISMFFVDWLVYSGITLVFKFQAAWTTSYDTQFRFEPLWI